VGRPVYKDATLSFKLPISFLILELSMYDRDWTIRLSRRRDEFTGGEYCRILTTDIR